MEITVRQMYDANMHFGHQTRSWNPKMKPYIYGEYGWRNKIHIIDLDKSLPLMQRALDYVRELASRGKTIMIVSTRNVTAELIKQEAQRCGMPYANYRWPGGTLTNFSTVRRSVDTYLSLLAEEERGDFEQLSKKDAVNKRRKIKKMERLIGGMVEMKRVPDALFIVDVGYERNALNEAISMNIPVVAVVDSNNSYENVDYMIPGNDDAISSVKFCVGAIADVVLEGRAEYDASDKSEEEVELEIGDKSGDGATTKVKRTKSKEAKAPPASEATGEVTGKAAEEPATYEKAQDKTDATPATEDGDK